MKKFDKSTLAGYRDPEVGYTVAHCWYYSYINAYIYGSAFVRYLVDEWGLDPEAESYVSDWEAMLSPPKRRAWTISSLFSYY